MLSAAYFRRPRSLRDILRVLGTYETMPQLQARLAGLSGLLMGTGWDEGFRHYYWLPYSRDCKAARRQEMRVGALEMKDIAKVS